VIGLVVFAITKLVAMRANRSDSTTDPKTSEKVRS